MKQCSDTGNIKMKTTIQINSQKETLNLLELTRIRHKVIT